MKKILAINKILADYNLTSKIKIFFSYKTAGDDFDTYENNYTFTNLNPVTIRAYISEISAEALVWKEYGLKELGAKEIICQERYAEYFRKANKIEIDDSEYEVFKEGTSGRAIIQKRPFNLIRVVLQKKS